MPSRRTVSMLEAGLVTFLWSSSFIFIKLGLEDIPPMTFAAYRYTMASAVLMAYVFARHRSYVMSLDRDKVLKYVFLGFCGYFIAQGMQFFGLYYLQAITVTFILNMTPLIVLFLGVVILGEKPGRRQLLGVGIALLGVMAFFSGEDLQIDQKMGVVLTFISGVGWAVYMVATRHIVRKDGENVVVMTAISMFSGAMMLLIGSLASDDICTISNSGILIIVWLALANTAAAFFLWNRALIHLHAYEQSILQNTMLIQITILAMITLGESVDLANLAGISLVFLGVLIVVLKKK